MSRYYEWQDRFRAQSVPTSFTGGTGRFVARRWMSPGVAPAATQRHPTFPLAEYLPMSAPASLGRGSSRASCSPLRANQVESSNSDFAVLCHSSSLQLAWDLAMLSVDIARILTDQGNTLRLRHQVNTMRRMLIPFSSCCWETDGKGCQDLSWAQHGSRPPSRPRMERCRVCVIRMESSILVSGRRLSAQVMRNTERPVAMARTWSGRYVRGQACSAHHRCEADELNPDGLFHPVIMVQKQSRAVGVG